MTKVAWDQVGDRTYETGVDRGVLFIPSAGGVYDTGFAWNGLTTVTEKPSGADANPQYADNIKYLNLVAAEEFGATIEAFTYPAEFAQCDGTAEPTPGVTVGQQTRKSFGLAYRTLMGNDVDGTDYGYKLHLVYGALASPTEKAHGTVNDKPEAMAFSWDVTTTPVDVPGFKPTAVMTVDSTLVDGAGLTALENALYGSVGEEPLLPTPAEVVAFFSGAVVEAVPTQPTFVQGTNTIAIPTIVGVVYTINGVSVSGAVVITEDTIVTAHPVSGYKFPAVTDNDWLYPFVDTH
jgi:hypothetical protein